MTPPAMTPPDPSADTLLSLVHSGAYACVAIVLLFLGLRWGSKNIAWLKGLDAPGRPHYVAAGLGFLAVLVPSAVQGQLPSLGMLLAAASTAGALLLPGVPTAAADKSASSQSGFIARDLMVFLTITLFAAGCAWWASEKSAVKSDVIDCTRSELVPTLVQLAPMADQLLLGATDSGGKVDQAAGSAAFSALKGDLKCIAVDAIARALQPAPADPSAPKASPLVADHASLLALKAALYPGVTFHTSSGDL